MRGVLLVGLAVVLLIVGILVVKNMGGEDADGTAATQTEKVIDRAESAADAASEKIKALSEQVDQAD